MSYAAFKIIHAISAAILFGGGTLLLCYCIFAFKQNDLSFLHNTLAISIKINASIFSVCGLTQLATGFMLISLHSHHFTTGWIIKVMASFGVSALTWLIALNLLGQCYQLTLADNLGTDTVKMKQYYKQWLWLSMTAVVGCLFMLHFMTEPGLP